MKHKTRLLVVFTVNLVACVVSFVCFRNVEIDRYSDMITFLSIMIGFKLTFVSVLFNSSIRDILYNRDDCEYYTALHRLAKRVKFALYYEFFAVIALLVLPCFRYVLILPIVVTSSLSFVSLVNDFIACFTFPRNEK